MIEIKSFPGQMQMATGNGRSGRRVEEGEGVEALSKEKTGERNKECGFLPSAMFLWQTRYLSF